jgi:hypothetical protein
VVLLRSLHHDKAPDAENVVASQPHRFERNAEADWTEVVVYLWYNWQQLFLNGETGSFCKVLCYELFLSEYHGQAGLRMQCCPLVKLLHYLGQCGTIDFLELHESQQRDIDPKKGIEGNLAIFGQSEPLFFNP